MGTGTRTRVVILLYLHVLTVGMVYAIDRTEARVSRLLGST